MGLQFETPWALLALLPAAGYLFWVWKTADRLSGWRKRSFTALRGLIVLLLVLSLTGLQSYALIERQAILFVADRSDSIAESEAVEAWIRGAEASRNDDDAAGVISAGLDAAIEKTLERSELSGFAFGSKINGQFTRLDQALQLAGSLMPPDASPRIVLLSDGSENVGDMLRQGKLLRDRGIPVDVVPMPTPRRNDASIDSLYVPEKLYQAEQYTLEVAVTSTFQTTAELRVYEDNREIASRQIELDRGQNRFVLRGLAKEQGLHRYRAELYASGDERSANNAAYAFSRVAGAPHVLIVEGSEQAAGNLPGVLDAGLIPYERIMPEMLSNELTDYIRYDSIVLADVSATRLSENRMLMIEQAVRDYGVGLMMTGGEDAFGLGGYFQTPIERALPVYMDLRGKRELPSLAMVLVIDKSGSMGDGKIELAQEAASRTIQLMREKDTIGVLAFDSSPWWVVEPQQMKDPEAVMSKVNAITADGGTEIFTAAREAYDKLSKVEAQRRHIILLTDGQSSTNQSYEALAADMAKENITMSTVAIGDGADTGLLEHIAGLAKGRYYFSNDYSTIPAIFSREAVLVSRTYIVDQPFTPAVGQAAEWGAMFAQGVPPIQAYIATTAKETAESVLLSPEPDPLLARWQYGAGKAVAWTSDLAGKWSADWVGWDRYPDVLSQIVKWTFPQYDASPLELSSRLDGSAVALEVRGRDDPLDGTWRAVATDEQLNQTEIVLEPTAPGQLEGRMEVTKPGAYVTHIAPADGEQGAGGGVTTGFVIPYSPEYRIGREEEGEQRLAQLAELTGGRVLSLERPEEAFAGQPAPKKQIKDWTRALLIASLLLWLADIALRRLQVPWHRIAQVLSLSRLSGREAGAPTREASMDRLRSRVARKSAATPHGGEEAGGIPAAARTELRPSSWANDKSRSAGDAGASAGRGAPDGAKQPSVRGAAPPEHPKVGGAEETRPGPMSTADGDNDRMNRLLAARKRKGR